MPDCCPLDVDRLRRFSIPSVVTRYSERDAAIYAVAVGAGLAGIDEAPLLVAPGVAPLATLSLVLGTPGFWLMEPDAGLDWPMILHGEQSFDLRRPLPSAGEVGGRTGIAEIIDKGPGRPALVRCIRTLDDLDGARIARLEELWVLRGAGGFGGDKGCLATDWVKRPSRASDAAIDLPTARNQALLYRLTGDLNPLHVDPAIAAAAGFERPILHGLATKGVIARAIVHLACEGHPSRLRGMRTRFTAPVLPGDTIRTALWHDVDGIVFHATVVERSAIVAEGRAILF